MVETVSLVEAAKTLSNSPVTYKELAEMTGRSVKYIRDSSKKLSKKYGLVFISEKDKIESTKLPTVLSEQNYKKVINTYLVLTGHPCFYEDVMFYEHKSITPESVKELILSSKDELLSFASKGVSSDVAVVRYVLTYSVPKTIRLSAELLRELARAFDEICTYEPTREQLEVISRGVALLTGRTNHSRGTIQSVAGASKSTCIRAIRKVIESRGLGTPKLLSPTRRPLDVIDDHNQTVSKFLGDALGTCIVGKNLTELLPVAEMMLESQAATVEEMLIVDEFGKLTEIELLLIKMFAKRVLFVGDILQLREATIYPAPVIGVLKSQYRFLGATTEIQVAMTTAMFYKNTALMRKLIDEHSEATFSAKLKYTGEGYTLDLKSSTHYSDSFSDIMEILKEFSGDDSQIVAYSQEACEEINIILNGGLDFKVGSKVMIIKSDDTKNLSAGTQFRVLRIEDGMLICRDLETCEIRHFPVTSSLLGLGFAMTSQRSQGSQWEHVLAVLGTSHKDMHNSDAYCCVTRGSKSVRIIKRGTVDISYAKAIHQFVNAQEGNRNNALYGVTKAIVRQAIEEQSLDESEVLQTMASATGTHYVSGKVTDVIELPQGVPEDIPNSYGYVPEGKRVPVDGPAGCTLTLEEAGAKLSSMGGKGFITKQLAGGRSVVIDCDTPEAVEAFSDLIPLTESYVAEDKSKAHIVFTTDEWVQTIRNNGRGLDFLGNASGSQLRHFKPNKQYNGVKAMPLTSEVLERVKDYIKH